MGVSTKTYRGRTLEELVPQIRNELGDDAVIVARREATAAGRIFNRRILEIEAAPGPSRAAAVAAAQASAPPPPPEPPRPAVPLPDFTAAPTPAAQEEEKVFPEPPTPAPEPVAEPTPTPEREPVVEVRPASPPPPSPEPERSWRPEPATPEPVVERQPEVEPVFERRPEPEPVVERVPEPVAQAPAAPVAQAPPEPVREPEPARPAPDPIVRAEPATFDRIMESVAPSTGSITPSTGKTVEFPALQTLRDVTPTRDFELSPEAIELRDAIATRGLGVRLAEEVVAGALTQLLPFDGDTGLRPLVRRALARRIPVAPLRPGGKIVAFAGPGGAGKTLSVARLCVAHARAGLQPVAAITLRSDDSGAELERLLAPHGIPVHAVLTASEAVNRIGTLPEATLVVLDTPSVSARATAERQALAVELKEIGVDELHLTIPATIGHDAARELVERMEGLDVHALALTHSDETDQLGTVVGLAIDSGLPISYVGSGKAVETGLRPVMGEEIAEALVPDRQAG